MYKLQRVVRESGDNYPISSLLNKTVNCLQMKKYITSMPLSSENGLRTPYERSRQATSWLKPHRQPDSANYIKNIVIKDDLLTYLS